MSQVKQHVMVDNACVCIYIYIYTCWLRGNPNINSNPKAMAAHLEGREGMSLNTRAMDVASNIKSIPTCGICISEVI